MRTEKHMHEPAKVSVHGGHSGTYCSHAVDALQDVVERYIALGFDWICLTEHMPTENPQLIQPEEVAAGFDIASLQRRFEAYFAEARRLAERHRGQIDILVGFEAEAHSGYQSEVTRLIRYLEPDMIVGSVHHLHDILFDGTLQDYERAARLSGGIEAMYCDYFDRQLELIETFEPAVVGHFDLIRLHDRDYLERWEVPKIRDRALRNLQRIKDLGLILDLNVRALAKGATEPYISSPWLEVAVREGIDIAPGDDSHGVESVGRHVDAGIDALLAHGGSTNWRKPDIGRHKHGTG